LYKPFSYSLPSWVLELFVSEVRESDEKEELRCCSDQKGDERTEEKDQEERENNRFIFGRIKLFFNDFSWLLS